MAGTADCIRLLAQAAGRALSDEEVRGIFERVHRAALDIKAGRAAPQDIGLGPKLQKQLGVGQAEDSLVQQAAQRAAAELEHEAVVRERQTNLQLMRLGGMTSTWRALIDGGIRPLEALELLIHRDYSGRVNVESLEQRVMGHQSYFKSKLIDTWNALGDDYLGFFQDRTKLLNLIRALRGEDPGDPLVVKGAKAFHDVAEEMRQTFNAAGGDIGRLDDWGMPQHHSQEKVAAVGEGAWVDATLPLLDRSKYVDMVGQPWSEARLREFLGKAWDTISTDGIVNRGPGEFRGTGKRANRHAEHRQIHFKDADSVIDYWERFGDRTVVEILTGHVDRMAQDIAFLEHFGPNPDLTYRTLRDQALQDTVLADRRHLKKHEALAAKLDSLFDYVSGRTTTTQNQTLRGVADGIAHLNTAGKLGGAAIASFFGDKPVMEAVSHLNDLPAVQRWSNELALLSPTNATERRLLQRQGLMLDSVRSGLQRFYEGLGQSTTTGKIANAVMRMTGMQAINDIRKGAFGLTLMSAIGNELKSGVDFAKLPDSDVRTLRNYGITETDWRVWQLAKLEDLGRGNDATLTPDVIQAIGETDLRNAGLVGAAEGVDAVLRIKRDAVVKLLGAVNTESEFAIVTPGWKERAQFYGGMASRRGTVLGEVARSVLQFKSFPWAYLQRSMDAIANADGAVSKAAMTAWLVSTTTLAGAMILQTREVLAGKDPRAMMDDDWYKFWGAAFLQGGALGIYGDFLYGVNQTRYGSGPLEALAGPTLGPLLELGVVQPLTAAKDSIEGKDTHLLAKTVQDLKGFVPGGNVWYAKAALDHLIWQNVMEALSPGYLSSIRSRTMREYQQDWWWNPGDLTPERAPDFGEAVR